MANLFHAASEMDRLDQLAMKDSPVHRLHPMAKLIATFAYVAIVLSFSSENISGLVPFVFYPVIMMSLSGTPYRPLLVRILVALPFSLMGGISNLLLSQGTAFFIGSLAVSHGMVSFVSIMLKTLLTVLAVLILSATTSFVEISDQLIMLRLPKIMCMQLTMTYRYLSILISEAGSMYTAYSLRAPNLTGIRMKDMGSFLGQLILRSFDRAERVYVAMKCRGFQGAYFGKRRSGFGLVDWMYAILSICSFVFLRYFNISLFFGGLVG